MKKIISVITLAILTLSVASAADDFRTVTIQILKPAKFPVSFAGRSLAIYSIQYVTDEVGDTYVFRNDTTQTHEVAKGIKSALEEWQVFSDYDIPVYDFFAFCNGSTCNDNIQSITDYNLLIAVRAVTIEPYQRIEQDYEDNYGYYYQAIYAPYKAEIEIFDTEAKKIIHKETFADTLVWHKSLYGGEKTTDPVLLETTEKLAATEIGNIYAQKIVPYWISVQRFFFVPSGRDLRQAADYAERSKWSEAMKIWEQYAGNNNRKVAAQSAFNMALGCEINGNYELALEWLQYAEKTYPIKEIDGYREILQRRIAESSTLEKQLQDL